MVSAFGEERFVFAGLQPGEYSLRAWTPERCGSVDRVIALAGTETAEVIIEMEPAATLVLRCSAGAGSIRARVRPARGLFVARNLDTFLPGDELRFVLPPGPTEITPSWIDPAAAGTRPDLAPRTVSLVVGEETVVDLGRP
jgi:hypothetical protein